MALTKSFAAVAILSSLTMATPAFAQARTRGHGGGDGGNRGGGGGGRVERSAPAPRPAPSAPRAEVYRGRPDGMSRSYRGPVATPRAYAVPRSYNNGQRYYNNNNGQRYYNNNGSRYYNNNRHYSGNRVYSPRVYAPRYYSRGYYSPRVYGPTYRSYGYHYRGYPTYLYRPYLFRPHFSIGFGFFSGYAVPYSYSYPLYYPVPYPVPYPSTSYPDPSYQADPSYNQGAYDQGAYNQGSVQVAPGPTNAGGVSFEVNPPTAQVFVDGQYVGTVETFDGSKQPLTLAAGQHRVELRADGFETVTFDVNVLAGQVIPYRGDMRQN